MTKVLLAHHVDDALREPIPKLIDRLQHESAIDLAVESLWLYEYRASMVHKLAEADYFVPVLSERTARNWDANIWSTYARHYPAFETIIPVRLDADWTGFDFYHFGGVDFSRPFDDAYARLIEIIAIPRSHVISTFGSVANPSSPIITVAADVGKRLIAHFVAYPHELKSIDRRRFEELVAYIFDELGYKTELTPRTRDGGRDVIAVSSGEVRGRYLIECKRPDERGYVSVNAVRELLGVKHSERATMGIIATTAHLSPDAKLFVEHNKWELDAREYDGLLEWLALAKSRSA